MESLYTLLSNLVLFLTLTTLAFALGAYAALVLRRRKPSRARRTASPVASDRALLRRYQPRERE